MRFSTPDGFCASHLLDRDGAPLGTGAVGGEGDDERGARFVQGAGARTALADGVHESGELAAFVEAVSNGGESLCPLGEARAALLVALAADRSRAERRPVSIEEVTSAEAVTG